MNSSSRSVRRTTLGTQWWRCWGVAALLVAVLVVAVRADPEIRKLSAANFKNTVSKGTWFVNFMSPYCGHCQEFAPMWERLAKEHAQLATQNDFHFATVDITLEGDLANGYDITTTPTLLLFHVGQNVSKFEGRRSTSELNKYILANANKYARRDPNINPEGRVVDLTNSNFEKNVKAPGSGPWFVKFFAPWCPHCKHLAPTWEELAKKLRETVNVGKVDCTVNGDLCNLMSVRGYPTLKMFFHEDVTEYRGSRKLEDLEAYALKAISAGVEEISAENLDSIQRQRDVFFVFLYDSKTPTQDIKTIDALARTFFSTAKIYKSKDPDLVRHYGISRLPALISQKDTIKVSYPAAFADHEALRGWIDRERLPLVVALDSANSEGILDGERLVVLGVFDPQNGRDFTNAKDALKDAARRHVLRAKKIGVVRDVVFAWLDGRRWEDYSIRMFGLKPKDMPTVIIYDPVADKFYDTAKSGRRLMLDNTDELLGSIYDAKIGDLVGYSTITFVERALKRTYNAIGNHPYTVIAIVFGLCVAFYRYVLSSPNDERSLEKGLSKFE